MNSNFNMVKKPKDEEELEDDEEVEEDYEDMDTSSSKSSDNDELKKRMFILMGVIVGGMILLLLVLYIASLGNNKSYSYSDVEEVMVKASKAYFKDNSNYLPKDDGDVVEIETPNLVSGGYMKDLSEYRSGEVCTGSVKVEVSGGEYLYTPYLNCGDSYSTKELSAKIREDNNTVTSGYGLYSVNGSYVFKGEKVNNYVQLDKSLWRVVKITSSDNILLINSDGIDYSQPWDDRYNESKYYSSGLNGYSASRILEYLNKIYTNPDEDYKEVILSNRDKARIVAHDVCVGKRSTSSTVNNNTEECAETLKNQKLSLLTASDYVNASIDPNCKSVTSKSCQNYNYLNVNKEWWLVTANNDDNSEVFKVDNNGVVTSDSAGSYCSVRPVIYLNSNVMVKGGKGTLEKPYRVK